MREDVNPVVAGGIAVGIVLLVAIGFFIKMAMGSKPSAEVNRQNTQIMQNMRDASKSQAGNPAPLPAGTMMAPPPMGMAPAPGGMAPAPAPAPR